MNFLTKLTLRAATALTLLCGAGATTQAQVIRLGNSTAAPIAPLPTGNPAYTCIATSSSAVQTLFFDPQSSGATDISWRLEGDYTLVSTPPLNGPTVQFNPTGYGKLRVSVDYYVNTGFTTGNITCGGSTVTCTYPVRSRVTVVTEFFKTFTQAQAGFALKGPTCVPANNPSVVYSVEPKLISTTAQIQSGIGVDDYFWTVKYADNQVGVPFTVTGDGSAIIIQGTEPGAANALTRSFTVQVQVGKCNVPGSVVPVTVSSDLGSSTAITNFPVCVPIGSTTNRTFTLNTVANVTYTLNTTIGTLSSSGVAAGTNITIPSSSANGSVTVTLAGITATNTGAITITGVGNGGCFGTQTVIKPVTRQLVPGTLSTQNQISQNCVAPAPANTTLTLTNAPVGQAINWTISGTGWSIISGQGTANLTVRPGTGSATVTAQAGGCSGGVVSKSIGISGPVAGCSFDIVNSNEDQGAAPGCSFTAEVATGSTCPTNSNRFTAWRLYDGAITTPLETKTVPTGVGQFTASISFDYQGTLSGTARVEVDVVNTSAGGPCLGATYSTSNLNFVPCSFGFRGSSSSLNSAQSATSTAQTLVRAYPNPTGAELRIDLSSTKGKTKLALVDALGRVQQMATTSQAHSTLDVSRLADGIYTLRAELPNGKTVNQAVHVKH
jgi:hypothetical protein